MFLWIRSSTELFSASFRGLCNQMSMNGNSYCLCPALINYKGGGGGGGTLR